MGKALINGDVHGKSSINGAFDGKIIHKWRSYRMGKSSINGNHLAAMRDEDCLHLSFRHGIFPPRR
jgi:hypothetical protein